MADDVERRGRAGNAAAVPGGGHVDRRCFEFIATDWRDDCTYIQYHGVERSPVFAVVMSDVGRNELQSAAEIPEQLTLDECAESRRARAENKDQRRGDSSVIPAFNASMVLPPFIGDTPTIPAACSPYVAAFSEYVQRFGHSEERREILRGLRTYRAELRANGFVAGYQWLDGSFSEGVEMTRGRPPGDIDVVTYAYRPPHLLDTHAFGQWCMQNQGLISPRALKARLHCEAFFIDLHKPPHLLVDDVRYWAGLFSHQRETFLWKGMVNVPLDSDDNDAVVAGILG